jgi:hypothetical protein
MTRNLPVAALFSLIFLSSAAIGAETTKAPCGSFKRLSDGKWSVSKQIKIAHGNDSAVLNPGTIISPGSRVAGADIYTALQRGCQSVNHTN